MAGPILGEIEGIGLDAIFLEGSARLRVVLVALRQFQPVLVEQGLVGNDRLGDAADGKPVDLAAFALVVLQGIRGVLRDHVVGREIHQIRLQVFRLGAGVAAHRHDVGQLPVFQEVAVKVCVVVAGDELDLLVGHLLLQIRCQILYQIRIPQVHGKNIIVFRCGFACLRAAGQGNREHQRRDKHHGQQAQHLTHISSKP